MEVGDVVVTGNSGYEIVRIDFAGGEVYLKQIGKKSYYADGLLRGYPTEIVVPQTLIEEIGTYRKVD